MKRVLFVTIFLFACYKTYEIKNQVSELILTPVDSLRLGNPVSALGLDSDGGILLLEVSGARIIKVSKNLKIVDSIILPEKIFYPKGINADEFFIYIYSDNNLYRYDRKKTTLNLVYSGIKPQGMAVVNTNEIYLSDPQNYRIIVVNASGQAKDFIKQPIAGGFEPTGLAYDAKNGTIWVINNYNQAIESYNRIGNLKASVTIFNFSFDQIGLDNNNNIYLIGKNGTSVWRVDSKGGFRLFQGSHESSFVATDILLGSELIYILDYQNRILSFKIPL
jgi:DNA-binding beta-propeller fold protein YncE